MATTAKPYIKAIETYEKEFERWEKRVDKIVKRYRDERDMTETSVQRFNIFWSNIEILSSVLYGNLPKPQVERRFKDSDPKARLASTIIERACTYEVEDTGFNEAIKQTVIDYLLSGRGQCWELYNPTLEGEQKVEERTETLFLSYKDFGHDDGRTWSEVKKVWRKVWFTEEGAEDRWGKAIADELEYGTEYIGNKSKAGAGDQDKSKKTCVYEVWDEKTRQVYWVSKNRKNCLESYAFPVDLKHKFPCPKPLYATSTNETLLPIPDYIQYQDQLGQIDKLTARIGVLTDALKIVGVYDSTIPALERILHPNGVADNSLVPVKNWREFVGKGGISAAVELVPIKEVAEALIHTYTALDQAKQVLYEVTGLADIIRGQTDPNETLGAQELKSEHGSIRIKKRQSAIAEFIRDIIRIKSEIICENYEDKTLWDMTNAESIVDLPPQAQQAPPELQMQVKQQVFSEAVQLLRDDRMRNFKLEVETDSTIRLDETQAKQSATEFVTAIGGFLKEAIPLTATDQRFAPLVGETLLYITRQYKAGRQLEGVIEETVKQFQQPQPPKPDPEMMKAQAKMQADQAKAQADQQKMQMEFQLKQAELKIKEQEAQIELQKMQAELAMEQQAARQDAEAKQREGQLKILIAEKELELKERELAMKEHAASQEMQIKHAMGQQEMQMRQQQGEQDMELKRESTVANIEIARQKAKAQKAKPAG